MSDFIRISVHLISLVFTLYILMGVDFERVLRKGHGYKGQMLYFMCAMALAYLIAQFILNISVNFVY